MLFMNEYDIDRALIDYRNHPVLGKAVLFLYQFKDEVDSHSDGWAHWAAPVKAAKALMTLIQNPDTATEEGLRKAISPIKAFYTRRGYAAGMQFPAAGIL